MERTAGKMKRHGLGVTHPALECETAKVSADCLTGQSYSGQFWVVLGAAVHFLQFRADARTLRRPGTRGTALYNEMSCPGRLKPLSRKPLIFSGIIGIWGRRKDSGMDSKQLDSDVIRRGKELDIELEDFERWLLMDVTEGIGDRRGF